MITQKYFGYQFLFFSYVFWIFIGHAYSANWMYLGVVGVTPLLPQGDQDIQNNSITPSSMSICQHLPGLVQQQIAVCQDHPDTIKSVSMGARKGIHECQYQFRKERWNCSTTYSSTEVPFGQVLKRGSKETAFVYAVTSAGVVHAVTQACSSGNLTDCSCDMSKLGMTTPQGWKWGGCSDNIRFGTQFARQFVDAPERERHKKKKRFRNLMNLHNNQAGREAVAKLMKMQCRCHGVSGSCELKTCWRSLPSFNVIGDFLKKKYSHSVQVRSDPKPQIMVKKKRIPKKYRYTKKKSRLGRKKYKKEKKSRRSKRSRRFKAFQARRHDLVYIHKSPNYCISNSKIGIPGTEGRFCNRTSSGVDSCKTLCCGRGYDTQVIRYVERCQCKFKWCCFVKCKTCITNVDVHTCK